MKRRSKDLQHFMLAARRCNASCIYLRDREKQLVQHFALISRGATMYKSSRPHFYYTTDQNGDVGAFWSPLIRDEFVRDYEHKPILAEQAESPSEIWCQNCNEVIGGGRAKWLRHVRAKHTLTDAVCAERIGGKRPAGRPALPVHERKVHTGLTVSRETQDTLRRVAEERGYRWRKKPNLTRAAEVIIKEWNELTGGKGVML